MIKLLVAFVCVVLVQKGDTCTPTVYPANPFDPAADAAILLKATKSGGTDEHAIIEVLTRRSLAQRLEIAESFKTSYGKDLISTLKNGLSGDFAKVIVALMTPLPQLFAKPLHDAVDGYPTKVEPVIEILGTLTNYGLRTVAQLYEQTYGTSLENDLKLYTSGKYMHRLVTLLQGVNEPQAVADADENTEESSGNEETGIVKCLKNKVLYFAQRLHNSMIHPFTKDKTSLIRIVVSRSEIDLADIKQIFKNMYGRSLESMIKEDTSGDYMRVLLALVG